MATVDQREASVEKNPGLAAVASFFIWGLGQIYNGQIGKGVALFLLWVVMGTMVLFFWWFFFVPVILSFPIWVWNIYDAYTTAVRINEGQVTV